MTGTLRLGVDIGGTFTDFTLIDTVSGDIHVHKRPSVPKLPSRAVSKGISELLSITGRTTDDIGSFVHGTTIALNATIERSGADVVLVVAEGTRDMLEIARLTKREKLNLKAAHEQPLVPRRRVVEVGGRVDANGRVVEALTEEMIGSLISELPEAEAFAVCLVNAHANPEHEERLADELEKRFGQHKCSRSTELWPEIREYERASVAVLNAYVQPIMGRYIDNLYADTRDIGLATKLYITQSNGGVLSAETARRTPVTTMLSGPASGVVGAAYVGSLAGVSDAVTVDIGGTSADVSLIRGGEPVYSTEAIVGSFPIVMPSVDVFAVGAGGGSIAAVDSFGLLKVGPRSAGADPGPVCYGRGGREPTVTDAYVVCGYVNPDNFLGGRVKLDRQAAESAIAELGARLDMSAEQTARNILDIATTTMSTALLPMMTKRGVDPRDFTLIPFGGAGPTHACFLADDIRIGRIVVPPSPGTLCALGASIADVKADYIRSLRGGLDTLDFEEVARAFLELENQARRWLESESPAVDTVQLKRSADMRYRGQAFTIEIDLPDDFTVDGANVGAMAELFHTRYAELYHHSFQDTPVDLVNVRVRIIGQRSPLSLRRLPAAGEGEIPLPIGTRRILDRDRAIDAEIYERSALKSGQHLNGPCLIEQLDTTIVVLSGYTATVYEYGILTLIRES